MDCTCHPIMIIHNDLHPYMCNTCAIERLRLDPAVDGVETNEKNEPTGMVVDHYCMPLLEEISQIMPRDELIGGYLKMDEYAVSNGVTTVFTKDFYPMQRILWDNRDKFKTTTHPMIIINGCTNEKDIARVTEDRDFAGRATMCVFCILVMRRSWVFWKAGRAGWFPGWTQILLYLLKIPTQRLRRKLRIFPFLRLIPPDAWYMKNSRSSFSLHPLFRAEEISLISSARRFPCFPGRQYFSCLFSYLCL